MYFPRYLIGSILIASFAVIIKLLEKYLNTCQILSCVRFDCILRALFTSFTKGKSGQVLIKYSLGAAYDMTYLHYNSHLFF